MNTYLKHFFIVACSAGVLLLAGCQSSASVGVTDPSEPATTGGGLSLLQ